MAAITQVRILVTAKDVAVLEELYVDFDKKRIRLDWNETDIALHRLRQVR